MPFFFRKLRANLPEKNRVVNYFLYALGEIIVVVIGILIALAVTNANEESKRREDFMTRLDVVEKELRADIPLLNDLVLAYQNNDSLTWLVLRSKATKASYADYSAMNDLLTTFQPFEARIDGFRSIIAHINDVPPEYDTLVGQVSELISLASDIDRSAERANAYMLRVNDDWAERYPWFTSLIMEDSVLNEARINYFLNDVIYKNRLAYFSILVQSNLGSNIRYYRQQAINVLIRVRQLRNTPPDETIGEISDILSASRKTTLTSLDSASRLSLVQLKLSRRKTSNILIHNKLSINLNVYQHYSSGTSEDHVFSLAPGEIKFFSDRSLYFYSVKSVKNEMKGYFYVPDNGVVVIE